LDLLASLDWRCFETCDVGDSQTLNRLTVQQASILGIVKSQVTICRVETHVDDLACIGHANVVQMRANGDLTYLGNLMRPSVAGQELIDTLKVKERQLGIWRIRA
jgi:hypothetical protein